MATTYKFIYFDLKGRGEVSRLLLELSGQTFEDKRITFQEWAQERLFNKKNAFRHAPILEVTENSRTYQLTHSASIERYLANKHNLMGKTDIERAQCDMIVEEVVDVLFFLTAIYKRSGEMDEARKKEMEENVRKRITETLTYLENILEANKQGNGYLVGDSVSIADVVLINFYDWLRQSKSEYLDKMTLLKQHKEKIESIPKIAEHLKKNADVKLTSIF